MIGSKQKLIEYKKTYSTVITSSYNASAPETCTIAQNGRDPPQTKIKN